MKLSVPHTRPGVCLGALALLIASSALALRAQVPEVAPLKIQNSHRTRWEFSDFTYVKLVAKEKGAPDNDHPVQVTPEQLVRLLTAIRVAQPGGSEFRFSKDERAQLSLALSEAFALARPGQDLVVLSTNRRGASLINPPLALTARMFWKGGALQIILHDARLDFYDKFRATGSRPDFEFGSRAQTRQSQVQSQSPLGVNQRPDWISLAMQQPAPQVAPAAAATPVVTPPPAPAPAPAPVAAPATPARDAAFFQQQEDRLRALKHLRDEKLISEDDYQKKLSEILQDL